MTLDPVHSALAVKRGALKLSEIPADQRSLVIAVLQRMTDAEAALLAHRQERPRQHLGRSHAYGWKAGS